MPSNFDNGDAPRVFLGLTEIAGYYARLNQGLRDLGYESTFINLHEHIFDYGGDDTQNHWFSRWLRTLLARFKELKYDTEPEDLSAAQKVFLRLAPLGIWLLQRILFCWAALTHDVFVFNANSSFFVYSPYNPNGRPYKDLPLLNWLGKRVIYNFHGADSYAPYLDGRNFYRETSLEELVYVTKRKKRVLSNIEEHADVILNSPLRGHLLENPYVSNWVLGLPFALDMELEASDRTDSNGAVRVLHAPSDPKAKGTHHIRRAISILKDRGHNIDYEEVVGEPNRVVLEKLTNVDFVIDQVFSTGAMPGLATEAAYFGRPTVSSGYYVDELDECYPSADYIPPVQACRPENVLEAIEQLVADASYRRELGQQAQQFVRTRWQPKQVAQRFARLIVDDIPESWRIDPGETTYLRGYGVPEAVLQKQLKRFVSYGGKTALQLNDKPGLQQRLIAFALGNEGAADSSKLVEWDIVTSLTDRAEDAISAREWDQAKRLLSTCIERSPEHPRAYVLLAHMLNVCGQSRQVEQLLQTARRYSPEIVNTLVENANRNESSEIRA